MAAKHWTGFQQAVALVGVACVVRLIEGTATRRGRNTVDFQHAVNHIASTAVSGNVRNGLVTERKGEERRQMLFGEDSLDPSAEGMIPPLPPPLVAGMTFPMDDDFAQAQFEHWKSRMQATEEEDDGNYGGPFVSSERIFNGSTVELQSGEGGSNPYGFYAAVVLETSTGQRGYACGGSLLSPYTVLTAAHCVAALDEESGETQARSNLWGVAVGVYCRSADNCGQPLEWRPYSNVYIHPRYDSRQFLFDLAMVEFAEPILGVAPVAPDIGGPAGRKLLKWGADLKVVGLGFVSDDGKIERATNLQELSVNYASRDICEGWWRFPSSQGGVLCTYVDYFAGGPCRGDSGGPVLSFPKRRKKQPSSFAPVLVGAVSFSYMADGCSKSKNRRIPDGHAKVLAGRDDLWGPLICESPPLQPAGGANTNTSVLEPPAWCQQLDRTLFVRTDAAAVASPTPPTPAPPPDLIDGIGIDPPDRYRYYAGVVLKDRFFDHEFVACGGVLIHPSFVLTLASCVQLITSSQQDDESQRRYQVRGVKVGYQCTKDCGEPVVLQDGAQFVVHPRFTPAFRFPHDVGLIRLEEPVPPEFVSDFPRLAVAGQDDNDDFANATLRFVGFDKTPPEGDERAIVSDLQRVTTTVRPTDQCNAFVRSVFDFLFPNEVAQHQSEDLNETDLYLCTERQGVSGYCLSSFGAYQFGAPLLLEKGGQDVLVGTANFRYDGTCSSDSQPEVFNRISTVRPWIQCVVCVGAKSIAQQGTLCSNLTDNFEDFCRDEYGIVVGVYDINLVQDLLRDVQDGNEKDDDGPPPNCQVEEDRESSRSRFVWVPATNKKKKCAKIRQKNLESLFCGKRQEFLTDARFQCPHACGLCE